MLSLKVPSSPSLFWSEDESESCYGRRRLKLNESHLVKTFPHVRASRFSKYSFPQWLSSTHPDFSWRRPRRSLSEQPSGWQQRSVRMFGPFQNKQVLSAAWSKGRSFLLKKLALYLRPRKLAQASWLAKFQASQGVCPIHCIVTSSPLQSIVGTTPWKSGILLPFFTAPPDIPDIQKIVNNYSLNDWTGSQECWSLRRSPKRLLYLLGLQETRVQSIPKPASYNWRWDQEPLLSTEPQVVLKHHQMCITLLTPPNM